MSDILAIQTGASSDATVDAVAAAMARFEGCGQRRLTVSSAGTDWAARVYDALAGPDVAVGVVGIPVDDSTPVWDTVCRSATPLILISPRTESPPHPITHVLLPLDGTPQSTAAITSNETLVVRPDAELVVLHVFDATTVPQYWDQAVHARSVWAEEFMRRHCPGATVHTGVGPPERLIADATDTGDIDLVVLGWLQHPEPGRSPVVRHVVEQSRVPVLLVPIGSAA